MGNPNIPSQNHEAGRQSAETSSATKEYQEELATLAVTTETTRSTNALNQEIQAQEGGADQTQTPETTQTPEVLGNGESTLTFELLEGTETKRRLLNIINKSKSFKELIPQGQIDTPERRLDILFQRINGLVGKYIERQFNLSPEQMEACPVLKKSLIPAIEWYLLDMLKGEADKNGDKGGNEANNTALDLFNNAKFNDIKGIWETISKFSNGSKYLYGKLKKLQRAIDFLVIHKDILGHADHYKELANPYLCMNYLSNSIWEDQKTDNLFPHPSDPNNPNSTPIEITPKDVGLTLKTEAQEIGMTDEEKTALIANIGNIQVVENKKTTKNIVKALGKAEQFMGTTNTLKDGVIQTLQNLNEPLNLLSQFGIGIESIPTDGIVGGIMNFFLSAMGIPGGLEGIQRERAIANGTYHTPEIVEDNNGDTDESPDTANPSQGDTPETTPNSPNLNEGQILNELKGNCTNLITFQERILQDHKNDLLVQSKQKLENLLNKAKELKDTSDTTVTIYQEELGKITEDTRKIVKDYLTENEKTIIQNISQKNLDLDTKLQNPSDTSGETDSQTPSQKNRESFPRQEGLDPYQEGGNLIIDTFPHIEESERENFKNKLLDVAKNLEINPNWLLLLLKRISDINPQGENQYSWGKGIFGITDTICKEKWNISLNDFIKKTPSEQLEKFQELFRPFKGKIKSYQDLVLMNFAPGSSDKFNNNDAILYNNIGTQNTSGYDTNHDGNITVGEVKEYETKFINKQVPDNMKKQFLP